MLFVISPPFLHSFLAITYTIEETEYIQKYRWQQQTQTLSVEAALNLWQQNTTFRTLFIDLLRVAPFQAYRWEMPPVSQQTMNQPFEFVLVDAPRLHRSADFRPFRARFSDAVDGIVAFENLGRDALMIVPTPITTPVRDYAHLANFIRNAPDAQANALWKRVGYEMVQRLSERPLWLSTAGGGVAWLHVRLDNRPKYYHHAPYKKFAL